jgi:hypothetical protein
MIKGQLLLVSSGAQSCSGGSQIINVDQEDLSPPPIYTYGGPLLHQNPRQTSKSIKICAINKVPMIRKQLAQFSNSFR